MQKVVRPQVLSKTLALVPPTVLLVAQQAHAGPVFLKIGDIKGEATEENHIEWIVATSFGFTTERPVILDPKQGVISAGAPNVTPLNISKELDKSSPQLFLNCAQGTLIPQVLLEATHSSEGVLQTYYKLTLGQVIVNKIETTANTETRPEETVELTFATLQIEYWQADPSTGKLIKMPTVSYDFANPK